MSLSRSSESRAQHAAGLRSRLRFRVGRFFKIRTKRTPAAPLYYSDIDKLTDDEWRLALAESPEKAARLVYAAAVHGNIDAQLYWAQMLLDGYAAPQDAEAAFRWFEIAAKSRRADAINMLGRCHERGWGVQIDFEKAVVCYRDAAEQGHDWAQFNLACLMMEGRGTARDPDMAFSLLNKAAQQNLVKSFHMIGHCYEHGLGCDRNIVTAIGWYRRSAESGDFRGQYRYGLFLFEEGRTEEALSWLQISIDNSPAPLRLSMAEELRSHSDPQVRQIGQIPTR